MGVQMGYGVLTNSLGLISDGCFLLLISIFIIFEAIQRVYDPPEMETNQLLLVSSIGLFINLWGMLTIDLRMAKNLTIMCIATDHNMRGVFLHVLADTLGSVGVIISTILIRLTGWTGFDPLASLFIAALIVASVVPLVIDAGRILCLDNSVQTGSDIRAALAELSNLDGLSNYGSPRFWPRCEGELVGSIHIQIAPSLSSFDSSQPNTPFLGHKQGQTIYANVDKVVAKVEKLLRGRIKGLTELVVQVEGSEEKAYCSCMTSG
ncbi:MAG: Putative zinc transporter msc2 [Tremellales sp. Tagirdzhanova-0007]|nr:MAG: Putative zinc transporter msc2 [Tremellales sp. Tagirdzhanova-0007]